LKIHRKLLLSQPKPLQTDISIAGGDLVPRLSGGDAESVHVPFHGSSPAVAILLSFLFLILFAPTSHAQDYLIGSQDVLKITVFEYPDLTTEARVSEDGKITFPLLGEVKAKNLTARQVEKGIAEKLVAAKIIKVPQVSVFVQQQRGRKVTIIGEVVKPGQYEIAGPTTLLDTISLALGMTPNAGYQLTVFRKETAADGTVKTKKIPVDVDRLLSGGDLSQNFELQNADVIYVPKSIFYVYGEVNKPGAYRLEKGVNVKKALALAGGLTAKGSQGRIEITRKEEGKERALNASIDELVQLDDVVRFKESIFYVYGEVNKPGAYRLENVVTVKMALALAGGLTPKGTQRGIEITRKEGGKERTLKAKINDPLQFDDVVRIKESIF